MDGVECVITGQQHIFFPVWNSAKVSALSPFLLLSTFPPQLKPNDIEYSSQQRTKNVQLFVHRSICTQIISTVFPETQIIDLVYIHS